MSMLALLSGFGAGYMKGAQQKLENERQAKKDAQDAELHSAKMADLNDARSERQRERDYRDANTAALSAGKQDPGFQITDNHGSNAFTKDADAAGVLADMAQGGDVQNQSATRVSTGAQGATMNGTVAGNKVFTDPAQAQTFASGQAMSDYAKLKARQDVADQFGKMDIADDIRAKLSKLESEGAFKAYSLAQSGDYAGAAKIYQSTGNNRLPEGAKFVGKEVEDPTTKIKRNVISLVDKDDKPIIPDLDQALRTYLSPVERYTLDSKDREFTLHERKTAVAEQNANTQAKKLDILLTRGIGGGSHGSGGSGAVQPAFDPLAGFDPKEAQSAATKLVDDAIAQGGKPVTPQERAALISKQTFALRDQYAQQNQKRFVAASVSKALGEASSNPAAYATTYQQAIQLGMTDADLLGLGFKPPQGVVSKEAQARISEAEKVRAYYADQEAKKKPPATPMQDAAAPKSQPKADVFPDIGNFKVEKSSEYQQITDAYKKGFLPAGRGSSVFGVGDILYQNKTTGEKVWGSKLFGSK